jgi:hypothetical protein
MSKEETYGQRLKKDDRDIEELENLIRILELLPNKTSDTDLRPIIRMYGAGKTMREGFLETARINLASLRKTREIFLAQNGPPKEILCPHCKYTGEFNEERITEGGFRLLQPVLEPRLVISWDGSKMGLSDPCNRHDPFDMISDPEHLDFLDDIGEEDIEGKGIEGIRSLLRGNWLFLCGKCLGYFDAREWIEKANIDYDATHPNQEDWNQ